jgi:hypothetical protein
VVLDLHANPLVSIALLDALKDFDNLRHGGVHFGFQTGD